MLYSQPVEGFPYPRLYVSPGDFRKKVMKAMHDDVLAGHQSVDSTFGRVATRFYWEGMRDDVSAEPSTWTSMSFSLKLSGRNLYKSCAIWAYPLMNLLYHPVIPRNLCKDFLSLGGLKFIILSTLSDETETFPLEIVNPESQFVS